MPVCKVSKINSDLAKAQQTAKKCHKLTYLCQRDGIVLVKQEESYTSKASFFDHDVIPVYQKGISHEAGHHVHQFSRCRIKRGLYKTAVGKTLNADVNGALNILHKSSVVSLTTLYSRGEVDTPIRIRVA